MRNRASKERDALKAEAEERHAKLGALHKQIGDLEHDLALWQDERTRLLGTATGANGGEPAMGWWGNNMVVEPKQ